MNIFINKHTKHVNFSFRETISIKLFQLDPHFGKGPRKNEYQNEIF